MPQERIALRGRAAELAAARATLIGDTARVTVLRGPAGVGRTALLDEVVRTLPRTGPRVVRVNCGADGEPIGRYGAGIVLRAVRDTFEQIGDLALAQSLQSLARLREQFAADPESWMTALFAEVGQLFEGLERGGRTVLVVDDAQLIAEPAPLVDAARRAGCGLLVACRAEADPGAGGRELLAVADEVIDLPPLPDGDVRRLISRLHGIRLDETVHTALRAALGPLYGHPGTTLGTVAALDAADRLVTVHGKLCLRDAAAGIPLPSAHDLLWRCAALGETAGAVLTAVAALGAMRVDELPVVAGAIGLDVLDCGRALDVLVRDGVLSTGRDGRAACRCPALATAVLNTAGPGTRGRLHARIAARLLADRRAGSPVDGPAVADHIAAADPTLHLYAATQRWLLELAAEHEGSQPDRAARWYAAAARWLPPEEPEHARTLPVLLDLVMRTAQYDLLERVLARPGLFRADGATEPDLRTAAVLVTMHGGVELADPVAALLDEPPLAGEPLGFGRWWFDGESMSAPGEEDPPEVPRLAVRRVVTAEHTRLLRASLSGDPAACREAWRDLGRAPDSADLPRLYEAAGLLDIATVFEIVFGTHYRVPPAGVLSGYRRVVRGYIEGNWSRALSAARELQLTGSRDTVLHHAARLIAGQICALHGRHAESDGWLAEAGELPTLAGLRAWVELGRKFASGRQKEPVREAAHTYLRLRRTRTYAGLDRLLLRVSVAALLARDVPAEALGDELSAEFDRLHAGLADAWVTDVAALAHGMLRRDLTGSRAALDRVGGRGDKPALLEACVAVAHFADDPRPWAWEAYDIAGRCESPHMRRFVRRLIRERGISAPPARTRRDTLSPTEQRIIELIRDGMTNRQIAADLRISEKTVEKRLTLLFARTGCRSRVELAAASVAGSLTIAAS